MQLTWFASLSLASCVVSGCVQPQPSGGTRTAAATTSDHRDRIPLSLPGFEGNPQLPVAYDGEATITYFTLALDEQTVRSMLPSGAQLLPQRLTAPGKHPVIFFHNVYSKMEAPGITPFTFDEFGTYIPAVRLEEGTACATADGSTISLGAMGFMPKLLLDLQLPVDMGVGYYGFNKYLVADEVSDTSWTSFAPGSSSEIAYHATFGAEVPLSPKGEEHVARFADIVPSAVVGQMRSSGALVWSGLEIDRSDIRALEGATVDFDSPLFGHQHYDVGGINGSVLGAFRAHAAITGSAPAPCTRTQ